MRFMAIERLLKSGKGKNIDSNSKNSLIDLIHSWGAGAGSLGSLEPEPLEKKTRSRSRLEEKSGARAAKKLAGSSAL